MCVSAMFDEAGAKKLKHLQSLTGQSASDVLKRAVDLLYAQKAVHARDKVEAILTSDFIGCAVGPEDLADQYKDYL